MSIESQPPHITYPPFPALHPYRPSPIAIAMSLELRRYCVVGSNAVSAFLSWRLQATNACDVTLVWKANFQAVAQYGISFKYVNTVQLSVLYGTQKLTPISYRSQRFGNERFIPRCGRYISLAFSMSNSD